MTTTDCKRRNLTTWPTCPCADCVEAVRRIKKMNDAGLYRRSSTEEALLVLDDMIKRRWSSQAIASAAGLKASSAQNIMTKRRHGQDQRLGAGTCKAIIEHGQPTAGSIGATGARRRLQALAYIGYSLKDVAAATGLPYTTVGSVREGRTAVVRVWIHNRILAAYRELQRHPGSSVVARQNAVTRGWVSPFAWEDHTIDDPDAEPTGLARPDESAGYDEVRVQRRIAGDRSFMLHRGESAEVVRRLIAAGWTAGAIRRHTGIKVERHFRFSEAVA